MSHVLRACRILFGLFLAGGILMLSAGAGESEPSAAQAVRKSEGLKPILGYIATGWDTLTRSMSECSTIVDPKLVGKSILYVPADFPVTDKLHALETRCNIEVRPLPKVIHKLGEIDTNTFSPHGLLYLEYPYVVPGGRFNEMYGWDSYFIIRGLEFLFRD
jgi:alpha,alpha-trehalase